MNITHKILIVLSFTILGLNYAHAQNTKKIDRDSVILVYRPNSSILMVDYKNNANQLQNIFSFVKKRLKDVQQHKSHINIVSYIKPFEVGSANAINLASIQASVVRAEFKTRYDIPHSCITFSIDTTQNVNNVVRVDYVFAPVPAYSNTAIFYTEVQSLQAKQTQMGKYKPGIPYTNYWMHLAKLDPAMIGGAMLANGVVITGVGEAENVIKTEIASIESTIPAKQNIPEIATATEPKSIDGDKTEINAVPLVLIKTNTKESKVEKAPKKTKIDADTYGQNLHGQPKQVFGLKTNLLYWATALPNVEFEFYMGKQVSLNVEGAYTWGWFLPSNKAYFG